MTAYESYPTTEEEGNGFGGYNHVGEFAGIETKKSLKWVQNNNIAAVHKKDWKSGEFKRKVLRIRLPNSDHTMDVNVIDYCDSNDIEDKSQLTKEFLIDLEKFTAERFLNIGLKNVDHFKPRHIEYMIIGNSNLY